MKVKRYGMEFFLDGYIEEAEPSVGLSRGFVIERVMYGDCDVTDLAEAFFMDELTFLANQEIC